MSSLMTRVAYLLAGGALLAGCGLKGDLETPGPMWGSTDREVVERGLPDGGGRTSDQVVFTRESVELFKDEEPERDPFADTPEGEAEEAVEKQNPSRRNQNSIKARHSNNWTDWNRKKRTLKARYPIKKHNLAAV